MRYKELIIAIVIAPFVMLTIFLVSNILGVFIQLADSKHRTTFMGVFILLTALLYLYKSIKRYLKEYYVK